MLTKTWMGTGIRIRIPPKAWTLTGFSEYGPETLNEEKVKHNNIKTVYIVFICFTSTVTSETL
jgi:hypothetical protein